MRKAFFRRRRYADRVMTERRTIDRIQVESCSQNPCDNNAIIVSTKSTFCIFQSNPNSSSDDHRDEHQHRRTYSQDLVDLGVMRQVWIRSRHYGNGGLEIVLPVSSIVVISSENSRWASGKF